MRFYTELFNMSVVVREPRANAAFLRLPRSGNHHDLGLFGVGTAGEPKRRGATKSIYGADPDGNEFEIIWMLPRTAWGDYEHAAPIDHLDLAGEVARWSGVRTAGRITDDTEDANDTEGARS